jgi:hypothetical protein
VHAYLCHIAFHNRFLSHCHHHYPPSNWNRAQLNFFIYCFFIYTTGANHKHHEPNTDTPTNPTATTSPLCSWGGHGVQGDVAMPTTRISEWGELTKWGDRRMGANHKHHEPNNDTPMNPTPPMPMPHQHHQHRPWQ